MNVFVLCTGRCGSTTFIKACRFIKNYSSAHESRNGLLGAERFNYPGNHIEADNRLSWLLGRLDKTYGDRAFYVHLVRDRSDTAASFIKRYDSGIIRAYRGTGNRASGIIMGLPENSDPMTVALDYCETVDANIEAFLRDKTRKMTFHIETAKLDFPIFCQRINAEVKNMERALAEFDVNHNASKAPKSAETIEIPEALETSEALESLKAPAAKTGKGAKAAKAGKIAL